MQGGRFWIREGESWVWLAVNEVRYRKAVASGILPKNRIKISKSAFCRCTKEKKRKQ